jgi:DNA-binding NarL/FixJ family response regulator
MPLGTLPHPSQVVLISDNAAHRSRLLRALAKQSNMQPSGRVLGAVVDRFPYVGEQANAETPVLVLQSSCSQAEVIELLARLYEDNPQVRVLVVRDAFTDGFVTQALRYGAKGFVLTACPPAVYENAMHVIQNGGIWWQRKTLTTLLRDLLHRCRRLGKQPVFLHQQR